MKDFAPRPPAAKAAEPAPGKGAVLVDNRASTVAQRKLQEAMAARPRPVAPRQAAPAPPAAPRPNRTGLPDKLKAGVEGLSGHSLDDVQVHYNSAKPAQLQAHAYAQGTDIHLGPGQQKHLPHEAWHVVQQKQGRVRPTRQMKGFDINDSEGLEKEADKMGRAALQAKAFGNQNPLPVFTYPKAIQLTRNNTIKKIAGGVVAGGVIGGAVLPIAGSVLGAAVGAFAGYWLSGSKVYSNKHKNSYDNELNSYKNELERLRNNGEAKTDYDKGIILKYSKSNDKRFVDMLHAGQVLYTYDANSQLAIGSPNASTLKHALVAEGKDIKAAGHAEINYTTEETNEQTYQSLIVKLNVLHKELEDLKREIFSHKQKKDNKMKGDSSEDKKEAQARRLRDFEENIAHNEGQLNDYKKLKRNDVKITKNNTVKLDNKSGHYHPAPDTKNEAFEAWHDAGFANLTWSNHS